jgi:hypothetical protein
MHSIGVDTWGVPIQLRSLPTGMDDRQIVTAIAGEHERGSVIEMKLNS